MPIDHPAEQRTRTVRAFLKLCIASSILQSALILTIYWLHLSLLSSYLLALIPIAPLGAALFGAARKRAAETDPYVRKSYTKAMITVGSMIGFTIFLITPHDGIGPSLATVPMPLLLGGVFALTLLMPKRSIWFGGSIDSSLGDFLLPVRNRLASPALDRMYRTAALCLVYILVSLASRILFDRYTLTAALAYAVALLPVLPLFGFVAIYNKYMAEEQDEFQRHLFHQSIVFALFGAFIFASVIGHLQDHALISQRASRLHHPYSFFHVFSWLFSEPFSPYSVFYIFLFLQFEAVRILSLFQLLGIRAQEKKEKKDR
jgi:hypothetical protein